jgi:hypothetical protein
MEEGRYIAKAFLTQLLCRDEKSALRVGRFIPFGRDPVPMDGDFYGSRAYMVTGGWYI